MRVVKHYTELIKQARLVEKESELERAAELYEQAIKQEPIEELPYSRLMTIYRKLKQPKDELRVIEKALAVYEHFYNKKPEKIIDKHPQVERLSKALAKSLAGKKNAISITYYPEPIPKWEKRKKAVEKRVGISNPA